MCGQILVVFDPYRRWTNYSNPWQLYPPRPPNFKVVFFLQGLRRVDKTNQTPQHDTSRTRCLTLTFGEGVVVQSFPRSLKNLSIYGIIGMFFFAARSIVWWNWRLRPEQPRKSWKLRLIRGWIFLGGCFVVSLFLGISQFFPFSSRWWWENLRSFGFQDANVRSFGHHCQSFSNLSLFCKCTHPLLVSKMLNFDTATRLSVACNMVYGC